MRRALALAAALVAGCGGAAAPAWSTPRAHLDELVLSVAGRGANDAFFAGGNPGASGSLALRLDASGWHDLAPPTPRALWWVFARGAEAWFVGEGGTILRWDGASFAPSTSGTTETLFGVWGPADGTTLWAVGGTPDASSVALRWDGTAWSDAGLPQNGGAYFKVWGTSASDVFVVGQHGAILHFDGNAWAPMQSGLPVNTSLLTVAGRAHDDVFAVGGLGTGVALHYDGAAWSPVAGLDVSLASGLAGVSVAATGDVSIVGLGGAKFRRAGGAWHDDSSVDPLSDLHGTWLDGADDIFAVGGNLNAPAGVPRDGVIAHYGP